MADKTKVAIFNGPSQARLFRALSDPFPFDGDHFAGELESIPLGVEAGKVSRGVKFDVSIPSIPKEILSIRTRILGVTWVSREVSSDVRITGFVTRGPRVLMGVGFTAEYDVSKRTGLLTFN